MLNSQPPYLCRKLGKSSQLNLTFRNPSDGQENMDYRRWKLSYLLERYLLKLSGDLFQGEIHQASNYILKIIINSFYKCDLINDNNDNESLFEKGN